MNFKIITTTAGNGLQNFINKIVSNGNFYEVFNVVPNKSFEIEISSMEELELLRNLTKCSLIFRHPGSDNDAYSNDNNIIEIYDDYRE